LESRPVENIAELTVVSEPQTPSYVVVDLPDELDVASMPELRRHLTTLISSGSIRLVLNAATLDFIDAVGIGSLVHAANRARAEGGWVRLIGVKRKVLRLLLILGLERILPVYECLEDALEDALGDAPCEA
jgi:anti-sigma B factor antagonist